MQVLRGSLEVLVDGVVFAGGARHDPPAEISRTSSLQNPL